MTTRLRNRLDPSGGYREEGWSWVDPASMPWMMAGLSYRRRLTLLT
jgi:hypothetical protein